MKKIIGISICVILIISMLLVVLIACKNTTSGYDHPERYSIGAGTYDASAVKAINVAWTKGEVHIYCSDEYTQVNVSEENSMEGETYALHQYVESDGTLWVKPYAATVDSDEPPSYDKKILTITMPKISLSSANVENHGKDTYITGIIAAELSTYNTGWDTIANGITVTNKLTMTCQGITGNCAARGNISGEVSISAPHNVTLCTLDNPTKATLSGKGTVYVGLSETINGFTADVTTKSKITCTDYDISKVNDNTEEGLTRYAYGTGSTQLILKCGDWKQAFSDKVTNKVTIGKYIPSPDPIPNPDDGGEE